VPVSDPIGPVRTTAAATLTSVIGTMPVFLVGSQGGFLRESLQIDPAQLGAALAMFMVASAVCSPVGGRIPELIGSGRSLVLVCLGSGAVMMSLALFVSTHTHLMVALALGGCWNSMSLPASNLALARGVAGRPAFVFGVRQSAVPLAAMLAGASVPLVSSGVGWRWSFALGSLLAVVVATYVPWSLTPAQPRGVMRFRIRDGVNPPLLLLGLALFAGSAASISLGTFLVEATTARGFSAHTAGWLQVIGSLMGIATRLTMGWLADRHRGTALQMMAGMLAVGAGGFILLGSATRLIPLAIGALLAFGPGWGWNGLLMFATVRMNPDTPATASGLLGVGGAGGAALGPLVFGYIATRTSYEMAWYVCAAFALVAAVLAVAARTWAIRDRMRQANGRIQFVHPGSDGGS